MAPLCLNRDGLHREIETLDWLYVGQRDSFFLSEELSYNDGRVRRVCLCRLKSNATHSLDCKIERSVIRSPRAKFTR